jgi:hypothetical protein
MLANRFLPQKRQTRQRDLLTRSKVTFFIYLFILFDSYEGHNNFVEKVSSITAEESLENLATLCSSADHNIAVSDFLYMLRTIHLRVRISQ